MECSYLISSILTLSRNVENTLLLGYIDLQKQSSAVKNAIFYWFKPVYLLKLFWWFSVYRGHKRAAAPGSVISVLPAVICSWCVAGSSTCAVRQTETWHIHFFSLNVLLCQDLGNATFWRLYMIPLQSLSSSSSRKVAMHWIVLLAPSKRRGREWENSFCDASDV